MDCLSLGEMRNLRRKAATLLANLNEILAFSPSMSPEELRAKTLESLDSQIKRCEALTRLHAIQKILKTGPQRTKELKSLQREERELVKCINGYGVALSGFVGPSFEDQAITTTMLHLKNTLDALNQLKSELDASVSLLGLFNTKKAEVEDYEDEKVALTPPI